MGENPIIMPTLIVAIDILFIIITLKKTGNQDHKPNNSIAWAVYPVIKYFVFLFWFKENFLFSSENLYFFIKYIIRTKGISINGN